MEIGRWGSDVLRLASIADAYFLENPVKGISKESVPISSDYCGDGMGERLALPGKLNLRNYTLHL